MKLYNITRCYVTRTLIVINCGFDGLNELLVILSILLLFAIRVQLFANITFDVRFALFWRTIALFVVDI